MEQDQWYSSRVSYFRVVYLEIIRRTHRDSCYDSPTSSPLTSLSSLDDGNELSDGGLHDKLYSIDDIEAAQVLFPLRNANVSIKGYSRSCRCFKRAVSAHPQRQSRSYTSITTWSLILLRNLPQPRRSLSWTLQQTTHDRRSARYVTLFVAETTRS